MAEWVYATLNKQVLASLAPLSENKEELKGQVVIMDGKMVCAKG